MITKGFIVEIPQNNNKIKVRIPYFEQAGIGVSNSSLNSSIFEATICYNPGNQNGYRVGDCVFLGFEDQYDSKPIILGKLYIEQEKEATSYQFVNELNVTNKTTLPSNTKIGSIEYKDLVQLKQSEYNMQNEEIVIGVNTDGFKASGFKIAPYAFTWSDSDDTVLPTMKAVANKVNTKVNDAISEAVKDGKLTIYQGNTLKATFTANSATNVICNLESGEETPAYNMSYGCSYNAPYFTLYDNKHTPIRYVNDDITAYNNNISVLANNTVLYEYFRQKIFLMTSDLPTSNIPDSAFGFFFKLFVEDNWLSSNLVSHLPISISEIDSFKVEMIGGYMTAAECTMNFELYTASATRYILQVRSGMVNGVKTYSTSGWKNPDLIQYTTDVPNANNTQQGLKVVVTSSEPQTRYTGYLYIITGA